MGLATPTAQVNPFFQVFWVCSGGLSEILDPDPRSHSDPNPRFNFKVKIEGNLSRYSTRTAMGVCVTVIWTLGEAKCTEKAPNARHVFEIVEIWAVFLK